jgi:DNA-nicking Smr family endonuclease
MKKTKDLGDKKPAEQGEDQKLWQAVTQGVKPYMPKTAPVPTVKRVYKRRLIAPESIVAPKPNRVESSAVKAKRGQISPEGRLDLHGMTEAKAFQALHRFIAASVRQQKRILLVITGKGRGSEGVLKRIVPLWLEEDSLNKHIQSVAPADPKDGGEGALVVRLKKPA